MHGIIKISVGKEGGIMEETGIKDCVIEEICDLAKKYKNFNLFLNNFSLSAYLLIG